MIDEPKLRSRKPRVAPTCLALRLAAVCLLAFSQASGAADLAEIYHLAMENDPQLGAAKAVFLSRSEAVPQGRAGLLPNITVGGTSSANQREILAQTPTEEFNDHGWQATLRQPIFRLDSWYRVKLAKHQRAEAAANFAAEQQALLVRVVDSYFNVLETQSLLSASNAERNAVRRQMEQVQQRFDVGLVAITDVLESRAAFDSATVSVIEAEGAQSTSFEPLLRLTGSAVDQIHGLADTFPVQNPDPLDEDAWVKAALENNYTLVAAKERVNAAKRALQVAKTQYLPRVDAEATYAHSVSGSAGFFGRDGSKIDQTSASVSLNMPIFQGGAIRSAAKQARYDLDAAKENLDLQRRQVVEATRNLYSAVNTDVARVQARLRGIESSQAALDATQTGYEVGTRNIVDVLLAQQRLFLSQFQYASARYQYVRDTLRLKQTAGILNQQDIADLNSFIDKSIVVTRTTPVTR